MVLFLAASAFLIQIPFAQAYTGTITYSAGTDTITAIGGNSTVPITFDDLYLADVAGGWGQVTRQGIQYTFDCKIVVGNGTSAGTTYFADSGKEIYVSDIFTSGGARFIEITNYAYTTFGLCSSETSKYTSTGITFYAPTMSNWGFIILENGNANAYLYLYSCNFFTKLGTDCNIQYAKRAWNCHIVGASLMANANTDIYNPLMDSSGSIVIAESGATITGAHMSYVKIFVRFLNAAGTSATVRNLYCRGVSSLWAFYSATINNTGYLINVDSDTWTFGWVGNATIFRQYEYDLTVLNGEITDFVEDANVTLSKGGVQIGSWLTNSSGQIETQTLTYGYYNQTGGNTMYDGANPFVLTVTHEDWADYTSRFYVTEKTKMTISMQDTTTANNAALIWSMLFGTLAFAVFFVWWVRR